MPAEEEARIPTERPPRSETLGALLIIAMMPATMATTPPAMHNQMPIPSETEK